MGKVSIVKVRGSLKEHLSKSLDLIGGINQYVVNNDRVLLKPNINGLSLPTNIDLIETLIHLLLDNNIKNISIGESSFGNYKHTDKFFKDSGYLELAKKYNIPLINFNKSEPVKIKVDNPLIVDEIEIAKEAQNFDKIINIPVMKVHYATGITLSLKNMKGLLTPKFKRLFHEVGLDEAIVDLSNTLKADLNIIDGLNCMDKMGPHGGEILKLDLIIAGKSSWEVDYIGCKIMNYSIDEVNHLKKYLESNDFNLENINIEVVGEKIEDVNYPFQKVKVEEIVPKGFTIHNSNACCTCENAFLLSCKFLENFKTEEIKIFMGKNNNERINHDDINIAFGNCCKSNDDIYKIKGCPPYPFELNETLKKIFNQE